MTDKPALDVPAKGATEPHTVEALPAPPGDSREHRDAESLMVAALSKRLGVALAPRRLELADGSRLEFDAAADDLSVLVEAWAHQGKVKAAQRNKVLTDALKRAYVARSAAPQARLILLFSDAAATRRFETGWAGGALRMFGVEIQVVELSADVRARIRAAQERQYR
jgi:hypothetical protein